MSKVEIPEDLLEAFAVRLYLEETGYTDADRYYNSLYKKPWLALARRLLESNEGQALLQHAKEQHG